MSQTVSETEGEEERRGQGTGERTHEQFENDGRKKKGGKGGNKKCEVSRQWRGSERQMSQRGDGPQGNRQHTLKHRFTDSPKCGNKPEVTFSLSVTSDFERVASSPFIAISGSAHLREARLKIQVDNLLWLH